MNISKTLGLGLGILPLSTLGCAPDAVYITSNPDVEKPDVDNDKDDDDTDSIPSVYTPQKMNILFIAVDDLRPELNCYGRTHMSTPNIDALSQKSIQFSNAFCNVSVSGANRSCLVTGLYPSRTRFTKHDTRADKDVPNALTLQKHLRNNGYVAYSYGKISHHQTDFGNDWSEAPQRFSNAPGVKQYHNYQKVNNKTPAFEAGNVDDNKYIDGATADAAIKKLAELAKGGKPFFFGVGFTKPHLPFNAPKKYWDLYTGKVELPRNPNFPTNGPSQVDHNSGEIHNNYFVPDVPFSYVKNKPLPDEATKLLRQGYYACVSYTDANVGRLIAALEANGLADNTIVILWGDHGWSLGNHTHWAKHTTFDTALRVPYIVHVPGLQQGVKSETFTVTADVYPTICDLVGIEKPSALQGESMLPALLEPNKQLNDVAICRYLKYEAIVKGNYAYTQVLTNFSAGNYSVSGEMLYDHSGDPLETNNIAPSNKLKVSEMKSELNTAVTKYNK